MSWLADRKATSAASSAVATGAWRGSLNPTAAMATTSAAGWQQPAAALPQHGGRSASSAGDQRNLLA